MVKLANNRLRSLPSDCFRNTKLETADLSSNEFQVRRSYIVGRPEY